MRLHNTLTGQTEEFVPIEPGRVRMYNCGPTVYDHVHIGNLRAFLTADIIRRAFEYKGFEVKQVMNITDVGIGGDNDEGEDKIVKGLKREGKEITLSAMKELTDFYTERFKEDTALLNLLPPHVLPRASDHIADDIVLIQKLEEKGFVYTTSGGVYFDTSKDPHYGKLGGTGGDESRIGENSEKKNQKDFAVWKFNTTIGYPSPWGQGFPGWHIECSAMSMKYLGNTFDIHTGGIDLAPIHHNNEIAQSESACGCDYAHYWIHNGFVNLTGEKMAKSEGNTYKLSDITEKGFSPLAYRYLLLGAHYRTPLNFTWEALDGAQNAWKRLNKIKLELNEAVKNSNGPAHVEELTPLAADYKKKFSDFIDNDLATPQALALLWEAVKDKNLSSLEMRHLVYTFDKVLGLDLDNESSAISDIPAELEQLLADREAARMVKNWTKADEIREKIRTLGYEVKDTDEGQKLERI
ncbi:MAG: cysteine--tRNA ligase [Parcubacteria group bacterium]|nr:cysteine--tRNA ligase [Parcubacteria group bacterium]